MADGPAPSGRATPAEVAPRPRHGLQRELMLSFTVFTLGVSVVLGLFAMAFAYAVEDRFIDATVSRAAAQMRRQHEAGGAWPAPPHAFLQRHDTVASLPADLRREWQAAPHEREFAGDEGRHYHLHWLGRPRGAPPDPPVPDARHPLLVAEVGDLLVVRPLRGELLAWWAAGSGGVVLAALALAAWRARRIAAPLVRLADAVARTRPDTVAGLQVPYAQGTRDDEVGLLARHLDALTARTRAFVDRERVFTRDVGHELRTPLAVLAMASDRLLGRPDQPDDAVTELRRMRHVLWDLQQTVDTLLALARETHAPGPPAVATVTLAVLPLLERVVLDQSPRLQGKDIELTVDVDPALRVDLPPGVLHILLSNLVGNAFSHGEPGPVRIAADAEGLTLENRGPPLPTGLGDPPGQPFRKGAGSAGFGLGLAIVHRLAEHQGLAVSLGEADGLTRVQVRWAPKAWLAPSAAT